MRVVLWGAHPRRAVYVGSRADRRLQARLGREAARRRNPYAEAARLTLDAALHGTSFVGPEGRIDPRHVATVRPGDLLLLQADHRMSEDEIERLRAQFRACPGAPRAMIFDGGLRVAARVVADPKDGPASLRAVPAEGRCFEDRAFRERWYAERGLTPPEEAA